MGLLQDPIFTHMRKNVTEARRCEALPSRFSFSWRLHSRGHHGADDRSLRPPYAGGQSGDDGGPGPGHDGGLPAQPVPLAVAGADPFLGMGVWVWGQGLRSSGPGGGGGVLPARRAGKTNVGTGPKGPVPTLCALCAPAAPPARTPQGAGVAEAAPEAAALAACSHWAICSSVKSNSRWRYFRA